MMRMRLLSFIGVVYVYLFRSLVLVVEMHDRLQIIAFHMSINAPASHCLHEGGLSPRVRGTRQLDADRGVIAGIIPACAGNTRLARSRTLGSRDHPRVCGEHGMPGTLRVEGRGSSRVCGEHLAIPRPSFPLMGSSPRVRGTLERLDGVHDGLGIIPACAGNTRRAARATISSRDHPRVCGEHAALFMVCSTCMGSSPRVRGTLLKIPVQNTIATELRLLFNKFAKQLKRCFTIRFGTMRILVVKVQQIKQGLQAIVGRIWHLFPRRYDR